MFKKITGYTLIEIIIVITILAILVSGGALIMRESLRQSFASKERLESSFQNQIALERLGREIREIRSNTPTDLNIDKNDALTFTSIRGENITYTLENGLLKRNNIPVANSISALHFDYLNKNQLPAVYANEVSCIVVTTNTSLVICPRNFY